MKANDNMRKERMQHGYKQSYVAAHLGITQKLYSRTENGKRHLTDAEARKLAKLYNKTPDYFYLPAPANPPNETGNPEIMKMLLDLFQKLPGSMADAAQVNTALLLVIIELLRQRR